MNDFAALFLCLLNTIDAIENSATNYVHPSTSLRDTVGCTWIFPCFAVAGLFQFLLPAI